MSLQAVYRYGGLEGQVLATQEIESAEDLPEMDEIITLPLRGGGERPYVVTSRFPPTTSLNTETGEGMISTYTIVIRDVKQ